MPKKKSDPSMVSLIMFEEAILKVASGEVRRMDITYLMPDGEHNCSIYRCPPKLIRIDIREDVG